MNIVQKRYNSNDGIKVIYDSESLANLIKDSVEYYQNESLYYKKLSEKNYDKIKEEVLNEYEEENKQLRQNQELTYLRFNSYKERDAFLNFKKKHEPCRITNRYNGSRLPYLIPYGDGLGLYLTAVCPVCGEKLDITDLETF